MSDKFSSIGFNSSLLASMLSVKRARRQAQPGTEWRADGFASGVENSHRGSQNFTVIVFTKIIMIV
jgi:hypothetical protein